MIDDLNVRMTIKIEGNALRDMHCSTNKKNTTSPKVESSCMNFNQEEQVTFQYTDIADMNIENVKNDISSKGKEIIGKLLPFKGGVASSSVDLPSYSYDNLIDLDYKYDKDTDSIVISNDYNSKIVTRIKQTSNIVNELYSKFILKPTNMDLLKLNTMTHLLLTLIEPTLEQTGLSNIKFGANYKQVEKVIHSKAIYFLSKPSKNVLVKIFNERVRFMRDFDIAKTAYDIQNDYMYYTLLLIKEKKVDYADTVIIHKILHDHWLISDISDLDKQMIAVQSGRYLKNSYETEEEKVKRLINKINLIYEETKSSLYFVHEYNFVMGKIASAIEEISSIEYTDKECSINSAFKHIYYLSPEAKEYLLRSWKVIQKNMYSTNKTRRDNLGNMYAMIENGIEKNNFDFVSAKALNTIISSWKQRDLKLVDDDGNEA